MKTMIDGVVRDATPEEIARHEQILALNAQFSIPAAPTKEQLLAELQALTAKINALG